MFEFLLIIFCLIVVLAIFPRTTITIIVIFCVSVIGLIYLEEYRIKNEKSEESKISFFASYSPLECGYEHPIKLNIMNNSPNKTVYKTHVDIFGYRSGYSDPVFRMYDIKTDKIVNPGRSFASCWNYLGLNKLNDIAELELRVRKSYDTEIR